MMEDLLNVTDLHFGVVKGSRVERVLKRSNQPLFRTIWQRVSNASSLDTAHRRRHQHSRSNIVHSLALGVARVREGNFALIVESTDANYISSKRPCDLVSLDQFLSIANFGFALKKGNALTSELDAAFLHLQDDGVLQTLFHTWFLNDGECAGMFTEHMPFETLNATYETPGIIAAADRVHRNEPPGRANATTLSPTPATTTRQTITDAVTVRSATTTTVTATTAATTTKATTTTTTATTTTPFINTTPPMLTTTTSRPIWMDYEDTAEFLGERRHQRTVPPPTGDTRTQRPRGQQHTQRPRNGAIETEAKEEEEEDTYEWFLQTDVPRPDAEDTVYDNGETVGTGEAVKNAVAGSDTVQCWTVILWIAVWCGVAVSGV